MYDQDDTTLTLPNAMLTPLGGTVKLAGKGRGRGDQRDGMWGINHPPPPAQGSLADASGEP